MNTDSLVFSVHWILMVQKQKPWTESVFPRCCIRDAPILSPCSRPSAPQLHVMDTEDPGKGQAVLSVTICEYKY